MKVPQGLCFASSACDSPVPMETENREGGSGSNNHFLAQQAVVSSLDTPQLSGPSSPATQTRFAVSGHGSTPLSIAPASQGLVLERGRLEALGCLKEVIPTLLNARRRSTNRIYERIWARFSEHISSRSNPCSAPAIQDILNFLKSMPDLSLSVSSLRVQVLTLSAFTGVSWAKHSLICQFFKGAIRLRPQKKPRFPKWDLPLVLEFLSQLGSVSDKPLSIRELTLKTIFLVAVTSAKRVSKIRGLGSKEPFLTFFRIEWC